MARPNHRESIQASCSPFRRSLFNRIEGKVGGNAVSHQTATGDRRMLVLPVWQGVSSEQPSSASVPSSALPPVSPVDVIGIRPLTITELQHQCHQLIDLLANRPDALKLLMGLRSLLSIFHTQANSHTSLRKRTLSS